MTVSKKGRLGDVRKYLGTPEGKELVRQLDVDPTKAIELATGDRGGFTVQESLSELIKPWRKGDVRTSVRVTSLESGLDYAALYNGHTRTGVHAYMIFDPAGEVEAFCDSWKESEDPDGERIAFLPRYDYFIMTLQQAATSDCSYVRKGWV